MSSFLFPLKFFPKLFYYFNKCQLLWKAVVGLSGSFSNLLLFTDLPQLQVYETLCHNWKFTRLYTKSFRNTISFSPWQRIVIPDYRNVGQSYNLFLVWSLIKILFIEILHRVSETERSTQRYQSIKSSRFSIGFRGISRLDSAFIIFPWFKLAHICIQVTRK